MDFTGERFTPDCVREIWYEHWHRYQWAASLVRDLDVLDLACGEGYGSALLHRRARRVVGVDRAQEAIDHATTRYRGDGLAFEVGDATAVPARDQSFDAVVSFETIEHLEAQREMLAEFRRVLKPEGFLIISSPDKRTYSDETGFVNEHHVKELYRDQFEALLGEAFPARRLLGQKLLFQSAIWADDAPPRSVAWEATRAGKAVEAVPYEPLYLIALCAAEPSMLPAVADLSLFGDAEESVYDHYHHEIRKNMEAGRILAEREAEIERLGAELERLRQQGGDR